MVTLTQEMNGVLGQGESWKMPSVRQSRVLCQRFLDGLTKQHSEPRLDIHVSDLVYCLRSAYFQKVIPKEVSETELMFFVDGARRHVCLQSISGLRREKKIEKFGVIGSIDLYGDKGEPIEIKTTRGKSGVSEHYLRQLGFYCVMVGSSVGHLIIQRILSKDSPWEWYRIEYGEEEIQVLTNDMLAGAGMLRKALEENTVAFLPKTEFGWKCRFCKYKEECEKEKFLI